MDVFSYDIITDSTANLPDRLIQEWGLKVLPLEYIVDSVSYKGYDAQVPTDNKRFYDMMRDGKVVMTTMASVIDAENLVRESFESGQDVLFLGFDSALSAHYDVITAHIERVRTEFYPKRQLRCVDTLTAAMGEGLVVAEAVKQRQARLSLGELADWVTDMRLDVAGWFTVDDLKYLQRGGRLSSGAALAGTLLSIKPVLHINDDGQLVSKVKLRGRRRSLQFIADRLAEDIRRPTAGAPVFISHADCQDDAEAMIGLIKERCPDVEFVTNNLDPVVGAHAGPGTVAVFFISGKGRG
jgi:DegV family protein with EDD domain